MSGRSACWDIWLGGGGGCCTCELIEAAMFTFAPLAVAVSEFLLARISTLSDLGRL